MKAPEKLYLDDDDELFDLFPVLCLASTEKHGNEVEYIRKDAFIKKACEWLEKNADNYIWYSDYAENIGDDTCGMNDDFIEDFKKYMEE